MNLGMLIFVVTAAVFTTTVMLGFMLLMPRMGARNTLKRRVALVSGQIVAQNSPKGERQNRKRDIQTRLREIEEKQKQNKSFAFKQRQFLRQAGIMVSLQTYFIACVVIGVMGAIVYVIMGYPLIGAIPVGVTVGFGLPRYIVGWLGKRRVKKFTKEFANAVDIIVRGIRSGLPVGECLNIISTEAPEPVGGVFREIVESQKIGLTLDQALERAQEQMSTAELRFFAIVLAIQAQTGGNLADTLQNLSNILRDRKKMADKVKALSSEARASAMIIGSLPFLMTALLYLVSPDYMELLFTDQIGQIMILCGLGWMSIGVFIMKQMVNFDI